VMSSKGLIALANSLEQRSNLSAIYDLVIDTMFKKKHWINSLHDFKSMKPKILSMHVIKLLESNWNYKQESVKGKIKITYQRYDIATAAPPVSSKERAPVEDNDRDEFEDV